MLSLSYVSNSTGHFVFDIDAGDLATGAAVTQAAEKYGCLW